jgi:hypothetical protein
VCPLSCARLLIGNVLEFYVGSGSHAQELYSISSNLFEFYFIYEKFVALLFDLHPSNQYILVRVIPICFHFAKMCLSQVSLLSRCRLRYLTSFSWGSCTFFIWTPGGGYVSLRLVNVTWIDLDPLVIIFHFLHQFWIASWLVYSLSEAMAGSLSVASTTLSSAKVAVVDSGAVDRFAVYSRYNNDPRTLSWGTPALTEESSVHTVSTFMRKCQLCKYNFRIRK